jgi:thymidylate synthase
MHLSYCTLLRELLYHGVDEFNERTGTRIKVLPTPVSLLIDVRNGKMPVPGNRKMHVKTAAVEAAWFLRGDQDTEFLRKHGCKIWDQFLEDDGVTIKRAYGFRWRRFFGRDQIRMAIDALRKNPSDRRVWISAWDPASDGLGEMGQKNVPCPVGFTLAIVAGRLNLTLFKRSTDVFVGLPYDVMGLFLVQSLIARELGVETGWFHVTMAHPHLYEAHWEMAKESLRKIYSTRPEVPALSLTEAEADWDGFIETQRQLGLEVEWPEFNPRPEVIP